MKLLIGFALVMCYCYWQELVRAFCDPTPKTYDDLMKLPAFTEDNEFQQRLEEQREIDREHEEEERKRKSKVG